MKANKVIVEIRVVTLDIDAAPALVLNALSQLKLQCENGRLEMSDGDNINWNTERVKVEF